MMKYQFVIMANDCKNFVEKLRELGMVDITTSGWEPAEKDRAVMLSAEAHTKAEAVLAAFAADKTKFNAKAKKYSSGEKAYEAYEKVSEQLAEYDAQIVELCRAKEDAEPWGDFSSEMLDKLSGEGFKLSYMVTSEKAFEAFDVEFALLSGYTLFEINRVDGKVYFVVVSREGEAKGALDLDAQILRPLTKSVKDAESEIAAVERQKDALNGELSRCAASLELIAKKRAKIVEELQLNKVSDSAEQAAEGMVLVMEGWAEESKGAQVDALLSKMKGVVAMKSAPTPEDNTPVKLKNNWYARLFELVGNLYAMPKYGTVDLTPFFAPFYMLFFAICLCDAGYGAIILMAGLALLAKGGAMRQAGWFSVLCGTTAVIFGFFANSVFGMEFSALEIFKGFKFIDFQQDFFSASMIIGVVQILFGMMINIVVRTRIFGFKYALSSLGWFVVVASAVASAALPHFGVAGFEFDSTAFYAAEGFGLALLLLFNNPEKNVFANIGSGVWEAYDRTTGLMSDVLSYIRLFAIGLSGGVLALVFNDLAIGMTGLNESWGEQGMLSLVLKIVAASAILLVGHGINLFMSTISAFVHPMRLTFVEFYKNAGFEMGNRKFEPLQKENN
ncbi:MAG: V-type ATPase 116kDa subunit family protein [Rikenellaceae bacterium]